jgi:SAM-dependent methyltransferase
MREMGWHVTGVEPDDTAVLVAQRRGLDIRRGSIERQGFPDSCFDAVTMNHVIEHLPDPIGTLRECRRVLKPGGKLVLFTPNGASLGHRIFRESWRGLEPPRHLHIFSAGSLREAARAAGFDAISIKPSWVGPSIIYESCLLSISEGRLAAPRPAAAKLARVVAAVFSRAEFALMRMAPSVADCLAAVTVK